MNVKDVPFHTLRVGDKVIGANGKNGIITELRPDDDNSIVFEYESEQGPIKSIGYHHLLEKVVYIGS